MSKAERATEELLHCAVCEKELKGWVKRTRGDDGRYTRVVVVVQHKTRGQWCPGGLCLPKEAQGAA